MTAQSENTGWRAVATYNDLERYVQAFASGFLDLVILVGPPGVQKSRLVKKTVGSGVCWLSCHLTPLAFYKELYLNRDDLIVIDDIDGLHTDKRLVRLLRCLCQTDPDKTVSWVSSTSLLDGLPERFDTSSQVLIIANDWRTLGEGVAALEDRGHLIHFNPSALEVHRRAAEWFWDQEIFDVVGEHLHLIKQPSMRLYELAWNAKRAGLDWRQDVLSRCLSGKELLVAMLKADPAFRTEEDRVRAFIARGGGARATYFNVARRIRQSESVPSIRLTNPVADADWEPAAPGPSRMLALPPAADNSTSGSPIV